MFGTIEPQRYVWGTLILDVGIGMAALFPILIAALTLGGFSFFWPWLILTPLVMWMVGWWRGLSFGNLWIKAVALNAPALMFLFVAAQSGTKRPDFWGAALIVSAVTVFPTAGGIKIRRRRDSTPQM